MSDGGWDVQVNRLPGPFKPSWLGHFCERECDGSKDFNLVILTFCSCQTQFHPNLLLYLLLIDVYLCAHVLI